MSTAASQPVPASGAPQPAPRESRELIPADSLLFPYIWVNPARMSGEPCFTGSRVPIQHLFDHVRASETIGEFLKGFPPVTEAQVVGVLDLAAAGLLSGLRNL